MTDAHKETIRVRNYWFQVLEDMLLEFEAMQKKADQKLREMEKRALFAEKQREDALDKVKPSSIKKSQTAGKKQAESREVNPVIKDIDERNRSQHNQ